MIFTNSRHSRILAACVLPMGAVLRFGGSDSESSTSSSSEVRDMRVVGGDSSANVSANDSSVTVFSTDHGAVSGGLALAGQAIDANTKSGNTLANTTLSMFEGALKAVSNSSSQVAAAYSNVGAGLQNAYSEARAPDTNVIKMAAVAAVLIVGLMAWSAKKG